MLLMIFAVTASTCSGFVAATLSLPDLQPVAGFSSSCINAYDTPLTDCPSASNFINPSGPPCTEACFLALISAGAAIQNACQYQAANSGTIIGQAFSGKLGYWLCNGENTGKGNAASTLTASIVITSASSSLSASSSASRSGSYVSSTSAKATSTTTSCSTSSSTVTSARSTSYASSAASATSSSGNASKTTLSSSIISSPSSHASSASSQSSTSRSHTSSSSTRTTSGSTSSAAKPSSTAGDSTPFDQSLPKSNNGQTTSSQIAVTSILLACLFSFGASQALFVT